MNRREALRSLGVMAVLPLLPSWLLGEPERKRIDLAAFCTAKTNPYRRYDISRPFLQGEHVYASDAITCVRVRPEGYDAVCEAEAKLPDASRLPWGHDALAGGWKTLGTPDLVMAEGWCPGCNGAGWRGQVRECLNCGGCGYDFVGHEPMGECRPCHGTGAIGEALCPKCEGTCEAIFPCIVRLSSGRETAYVAANQYERIRSVVGAAEYCVLSGDHAIRFRFEGGLGLLMVLDRVCAEERIAAAKKGPIR